MIPGLAIMLSKSKPKMDGKDKDMEMDDPEMDKSHSKEDTKHAVMKAFIEAVHDKDVDAACQAYADLKDLHGGDEEEDY